MADSYGGSYWVDILNAVKHKLATIENIPPIRRRKRHVRNANSKEPAILILISAVSDEKIGESFFAPDPTDVDLAAEEYPQRRGVQIRYTVKVTVSMQQNTQYEEDPDEPLIWRERIRQKFLQPRLEGALPGDNPNIDANGPALEGSATVYDSNVLLGQVYDESGQAATFDSTSLLLTFDSIEPANGPYTSEG